MLDTTQLPTDLQESIWTEYHNQLRNRIQSLQYHIRTLCLTDGNSDLVLNWMAHMLQYPNVKPQKGIILVGPPRCGKTLFATLLSLLSGQDTVYQTNTLRMQFNHEMEDKTLVHLDECDLRDELPEIRTFISDQNITINRPFQQPYNVPSHHRVIITTNTLSPLLNHSNAFQQRFTVIPCGSVSFNPQEFHTAMNDPVKVAELRQYLMQRSVRPDFS